MNNNLFLDIHSHTQQDVQIASLEEIDKSDRKNVVQDMVIVYRSTLYPPTRVPTYEAVRGAIVRIKLDHVDPHAQNYAKDDFFNQREKEYKQRMKQKREDRGQKEGCCWASMCWSGNQRGANEAHPMNQSP